MAAGTAANPAETCYNCRISEEWVMQNWQNCKFSGNAIDIVCGKSYNETMYCCA